MKPLILFLLFVSNCFFAKATNYYFSSTGDDNYLGTSENKPWKTISKFNAFFNSFKPGDSVLFKRSETFYGEMIISNSGTSTLPIVISAYGKGISPTITGFRKILKWESLNQNIWQNADAFSTLSNLNIITINGLNTAMGRFPNAGYLPYQNFTSNSIVSNSLPGNTDWTGATAVIRKKNWILDKDIITSQTGTQLFYTKNSIYSGIKNYGFFIENDLRTLDQQNEWFYDGVSKKLKMWSNEMPSNVYASTIDTLVLINNVHNIIFNGISFTGSNKTTFAIHFSNHIQIINCNINFSGEDALVTRGGGCDHFKMTNSTINHTNNNAIDLGGSSPDCIVSNDTIKNTGLIAGMGRSGDGTYIAIQNNSDNGIIENCFIDSTGYNGIVFYGNNTIVKNNFVSNFCMTKFDGGGIYTFISIGGKPFTGQKLIGNIIINGIGNIEGTSEKFPLVHGIYLDEGTANVEIKGNAAANNSYSGLYYHSSYSNNVHDNIFYNNKLCQFLLADYNSKNADRNLKFKNNILVSVNASQKISSYQSRIDDIQSFGAPSDVDNNYYITTSANNIIETISNNYRTIQYRSFTEWQSYSGYDKHSNLLIKSDSEIKYLRFEYNPTASSKVINLDSTYLDITNKSYHGKIIVNPFTFLLLIKKN